MVRFASYEQGVPAWVELAAGDQRVAAGFYADRFGWRMVEHPVPEGVYLTAWLDEDVVAGVEAAPNGGPAAWRVYLAVDDVDASIAVVEELGGRVVAPAFDVPGVGRMAMLADPQGATFWLMAVTAA